VRFVPLRLILLGLLLLAFFRWVMPPLRVSTKKQMERWALRIGVAAGLLVLLRFGLPWLAVIGAALAAVLRLAAPVLLRVLPFLLHRHGNTNATGIPGHNQGAPGFRGSSDRTRAHALEVLDLQEGASREEILNAYRELIKKVHPDRGGSSYLAAEVNRARDVLLADESN
jgi:hypothetical protein